MVHLMADRHTANGKVNFFWRAETSFDASAGRASVFLWLNYIHSVYLVTWADNDRSLSWMGPVMEALSKSYQKYEMGAGSSRSEEEHRD